MPDKGTIRNGALAAIPICHQAEPPMQIRTETPGDADAIERLISEAFLTARIASGTEAGLVSGLRAANALSLSLVGIIGNCIVAHVAFSPVTISGRDTGWLGLGPVAVHMGHRRHGYGASLIREGLRRIHSQGARGCVVLGDARYYARFGFRQFPSLVLPGVPPEVFTALAFDDAAISGVVAYHSAFG